MIVDYHCYKTRGAVKLERNTAVLMASSIKQILVSFNSRRRDLLTSSYEYPGRYNWTWGVVAPLELACTRTNIHAKGNGARNSISAVFRTLATAIAARIGERRKQHGYESIC